MIQLSKSDWEEIFEALGYKSAYSCASDDPVWQTQFEEIKRKIGPDGETAYLEGVEANKPVKSTVNKLRLEQFMERYPRAEKMDNCCQDRACSNCGNRDNFRVEIKTMADLCDDGTDGDVGDHEHDEDSYMECRNCGAHGPASHFNIEGLDDAIELREEGPQ